MADRDDGRSPASLDLAIAWLGKRIADLAASSSPGGAPPDGARRRRARVRRGRPRRSGDVAGRPSRRAHAGAPQVGPRGRHGGARAAPGRERGARAATEANAAAAMPAGAGAVAPLAAATTAAVPSELAALPGRCARDRGPADRRHDRRRARRNPRHAAPRPDRARPHGPRPRGDAPAGGRPRRGDRPPGRGPVRPTRPSAVLLGPDGIGKASIVEGLAERVVAGEVPAPLRDARIIEVPISALVAGTQYRGQLEERLGQLVREASQPGSSCSSRASTSWPAPAGPRAGSGRSRSCAARSRGAGCGSSGRRSPTRSGWRPRRPGSDSLLRRSPSRSWIARRPARSSPRSATASRRRAA